jgi:hypothetical protein
VSVVTRLSNVLDRRLSRRSFVVRTAFAGSALSVGGLHYVLTPGRAYASICSCGNSSCGCGTTCCAGYTEFCCVINGGFNYCPSDTVMGGWWKADGSSYCAGPRYYMDCNAVCSCTDGCGDGNQFCDPGCDGLTCGCAEGTCDNYLTGCFQFRYGQCNQHVSCLGRIKCRVVTCVAPWEIDPTCTRAAATDDGTAEQNAPCLTPGPTKPCSSPSTDCQVVGIALSNNSAGYAIVTAVGKAMAFGDEGRFGDLDPPPAHPVVGVAAHAGGGYWVATAGGQVLRRGAAGFYGDAAGAALRHPVVGLAATRTGLGYWLVTRIGRVRAYGDAVLAGPATRAPDADADDAVVGMAETATGHGYWLVTATGEVVGYGDAVVHGRAEASVHTPIVGICSTPSGAGYWLVAANGGVHAFGDAGGFGHAAARSLDYPIVGMARTRSGLGYALVSGDGRVFTFGDAGWHGSAGT